MNIWIFNHYAVPPDVPGITRHYDFSRELQKRGHRVTIFAAGFNHLTRRDERLQGGQCYRKETLNNVDFVWVKSTPYYKGNDWRRALNMLSYAFSVILPGIKLKPGPDIIIASSPHPFSGLAGYFLAKLKRAGFFFEVRDLWPETLVEIGGYDRNSLIVKFLKIIEKFLYRRAGKIIVLHPKASDYITGLGIRVDKITYIPNGISLEIMGNASSGPPEKIKTLISGLKTDRKVILGYTGAHGVVNTLNTALEAMRLLKQNGYSGVHLIMVGSGTEKPKLVEKAQEWHLDNVTFLEPVPKNNIPGLLKAMDAGIITTKKTGLYKYGTSINKLYDYMAAPMPVIWAADVAEDPVLAAECGITVPPEDPEALANAIMRLCNMDEDTLRQMAMRGYDYVMKYHSIPVLVEQLLGLIRAEVV